MRQKYKKNWKISIFGSDFMGILSFGASAISSAVPQRYLKVKNRNKITIHAPIYIKFNKKARYMVIKLPIKFKIQI